MWRLCGVSPHGGLKKLVVVSLPHPPINASPRSLQVGWQRIRISFGDDWQRVLNY